MLNMDNDMRTIEERADRAIYEPTDGHSLKACEVVAFARGYELGANEQRNIDIIRVRQFLERESAYNGSMTCIDDLLIEELCKTMEDKI